MEFLNAPQVSLARAADQTEMLAMRLARRYLFATGVVDADIREHLAAQIVASARGEHGYSGTPDELSRAVLEAAHALLVDSVARNLMRNDLAGFADTECGALLFRDLRGRSRAGERDEVLTGKFPRLSATPPLRPKHMTSQRAQYLAPRPKPQRSQWMATLYAARESLLCVLSLVLLVWPR